MPKIDDPDEQKARAIAVGSTLHLIAEGVMEGVWKNFKFNVRQHRVEKRDRYNRLVYASPSKVEITFSMDVDEDTFKADMDKRKKEVAKALDKVENEITGALIEYDGTKQ